MSNRRRSCLSLVAWILLAVATGCSSSSTIVGADGNASNVDAVDPVAAEEPTAAPTIPTVAEVAPEAIGRSYSPYSSIPDKACATYELNDMAIVVPCDQPHDFQKYANAENPDGAYPGIDVLLASCYPYFLDFAGVPIGESGLFGEGWYPLESDWAAGDHDVECLIWFEGPVSGSLPDLDLAAGFNGRIPWSSVTPATCVAELFDIDAVSVGTTDCDDDLSIDVLGLVGDTDEMIDVEACNQLADDAGYAEAFVERSSLLVIRGFEQSICYAEFTPAPINS